ncbi:MAG: hypothetical protein ACI89X_003536 [Planctomycetota bacterium]|jgi:hypothetical protein
MMAIHRNILVLGACAAMTACGSIPKKSFTFSAIDNGGASQSCLIVIDDEWDTAIANEWTVGNDGDESCSITVEFKTPKVEVTVVPFKRGMDLPRSRSQSVDYKSYTRTLRVDDPETHLFILEKKPRR